MLAFWRDEVIPIIKSVLMMGTTLAAMSRASGCYQTNISHFL